MKMPTNPFTAALRAGKPQIGLWISMGSNYAAETVSTAGFDWVVIDTEHTPATLNDVLSLLQVFEATQTTALVRPDWNDTVQIKRILDLGAQGLVIPMVQNVAEAEAAVAATRYPPRGVRGVAGTTRANKFGRITDYNDRVEEEQTVIVQIETQSALDQAEAIAAVDGVTGIFFGPADIAADLGYLGQPLADEVWDVILPVAKALMAKGVPVGTLVTNPEKAAALFKEGFTFIACATDAGLLARAADGLLTQMNTLIGKTS